MNINFIAIYLNSSFVSQKVFMFRLSENNMDMVFKIYVLQSVTVRATLC